MPFADTLVLKNNANADVSYLLQGRLAGSATRIRSGDDLLTGRIFKVGHSVEKTQKGLLTVQRDFAQIAVTALDAANVLQRDVWTLTHTGPQTSSLSMNDRLDGFFALKAFMGITDCGVMMLQGMS